MCSFTGTRVARSQIIHTLKFKFVALLDIKLFCCQKMTCQIRETAHLIYLLGKERQRFSSVWKGSQFLRTHKTCLLVIEIMWSLEGRQWSSNKEFSRNCCIQYINQEKGSAVHSFKMPDWTNYLLCLRTRILVAYHGKTLIESNFKNTLIHTEIQIDGCALMCMCTCTHTPHPHPSNSSNCPQNEQWFFKHILKSSLGVVRKNLWKRKESKHRYNLFCLLWCSLLHFKEPIVKNSFNGGGKFQGFGNFRIYNNVIFFKEF